MTELLVHSGASVMDRLGDQFLRQGRFEPQDDEYHLIRQNAIVEKWTDDEEVESSRVYGQYELFWSNSRNEVLPDGFINYRQGDNDTTLSTLRCIFQRTRPQHISGVADPLPFRDEGTLRYVFESLDLPSSYFQIADGSLATVLAHTHVQNEGMYQFELVAHCLTKQGDWAMALSHRSDTLTTSVFLSVDRRVRSDLLTDDLKLLSDYSVHPMLLPCIVFSATFRMAALRRTVIKGKVSRLEKALARITSRQTPKSDAYHSMETFEDEGEGVSHLFELLQGCRNDQASRKGQSDFWKSYNDAIDEGFRYTTRLLAISHNEQLFKAHKELQHWKMFIWQRLQSLNERDKDHANRVDNLSHMLYNLVQQRDMRVQSSIARASQRDSEDMKFIAVLGSVFLPASLVATVLNVPEFQFLPGAKLFGAYVAITIPFIIIVVIACLTRPYWTSWTRWTPRVLKRVKKSQRLMNDK